ncbi:MAG: peptide chain release factor N(5)-glutamine methyltransferase [Verrucomicrobia bacterium]|nr:peptide chain release factor N(5)-glutamine methyltransferase [Verrucomicrobiota bacterium]
MNSIKACSHVSEALKWSITELASHGIANPRLIAEMLVAHILSLPRLELYLHADAIVKTQDVERLQTLVEETAEGAPIQYVLGGVDFMGIELRTDSRALIPRPETEQLAEAVLACEPLWSIPQPAVADVGTGSGAIMIAIALAKENARGLGIDVSPDALALARENAVTHGLEGRIEWRQADLLSGLQERSLDAVVSNPPYIPTKELASLPREIRDHEPVNALDGGMDGLRVISKLVHQAATVLKSGGHIFMEIGDSQGNDVIELLRRNGFRNAAVRKDLAGKERIAWAILC